jgi:ATP-dependent DNA ligase
MKATLVDSMPPGSWIFEIKLDGYRALALRGGNQTRILSRNQKDLGKKFQIIADSIAELAVQDAVIDGEIVALDDKGRPSFQLLQGFDMGLVRPPILFYAFDLLRLNGQDLRWLVRTRFMRSRSSSVGGSADMINEVYGFEVNSDFSTTWPFNGVSCDESPTRIL